MDTKTPLDELLTRTMDRKQFIQHLGMGMLMLFGLGSLLKLLASNQQSVTSSAAPQSPAQPATYNASVYAGRGKG